MDACAEPTGNRDASGQGVVPATLELSTNEMLLEVNEQVGHDGQGC